jgi:hypothetical protein
LTQKSITDMEHPPYSLIWFRMTSVCFKIKPALKWRRFLDSAHFEKMWWRQRKLLLHNRNSSGTIVGLIA